MEMLVDNEKFSDEQADSKLAEFLDLDVKSFHPSTNWTDCGSLVERFDVMVQPAFLDDGEKWWIAGCPMPMVNEDTPPLDNVFAEDTPQRAITRAALSIVLQVHSGTIQ